MSTPAVNSSEALYRQIGPGGSPIYFDPARNPPVHQSRFLPTKSDTDGLSVIRRQFRSEIWAAYRAEQPAIRFRLARIHAHKVCEAARTLGFDSLLLAPSEDGLDMRFGEPLAHCVIAEINRTDYDNHTETRKRIKEWALAVTSLISNNDVLGPFSEPTEGDLYRPILHEEVGS